MPSRLVAEASDIKENLRRNGIGESTIYVSISTRRPDRPLKLTYKGADAFAASAVRVPLVELSRDASELWNRLESAGLTVSAG